VATTGNPGLEGNLGSLLIEISMLHQEKKRYLKFAKLAHLKLIMRLEKLQAEVCAFEVPDDSEDSH
jgi:hypothetical protein